MTPSETISTNSIRPNLHQYLERDLTLWNTDVTQPQLPKRNGYNIDTIVTKRIVDSNVLASNKFQISNSNRNIVKINENNTKWRPTQNHSVVDIIPRPQEERLGLSQHSRVYQTELSEEASTTSTTNMYRYHNDSNLVVSDRIMLKPERSIPELQKTRQNGERNKVKFSDTVTIAVVSVSLLLCYSAPT